MIPDYELIRSRRKTISIQLKPDGALVVRAPQRLSRQRIEAFVEAHAHWIETHRAAILQRRAAQPHVEKLTEEELQTLVKQARQVIPERVAHFQPYVGVTSTGITIRKQRTRWGSCSAKGHLNFNCLLMLAPPEVLDSVVVHELCHLLEPNHSARFYAEVLRVFPSYWECDKWLKENGDYLLRRLTGD